ncbi:MAG: hypothetical protein ABIZ56_10465 [Chthoniobacteraceae bacterium]
MPSTKTTPDSGRSPEQFIADQLAVLKTNAQRCLDDVDAQTQLHPHQTLLWALGTGYLLRMLPTTRIIGGVAGLAVTLLKPAALAYGVSKIWQATRKSTAFNRPQQPS